MKLPVVKSTGSKQEIKVSDIFDGQVNQVILAQAVHVYLSNQRQGTAQTQTRSMVTRTTKKWYRQKGTGNARHGAKSANLFVGGSVAHGPTGEENWSKKLSKKMKIKALINGFRAQIKNIVINDEIDELNGKTKQAFQLLDKIVGLDHKVLIVVASDSEKVKRSLANLPTVSLINSKYINVLDIVSVDKIVMTKEALKGIEEKILKTINIRVQKKSEKEDSKKSKNKKKVKKTTKKKKKKQVKKSTTKAKLSKKSKKTKKSEIKKKSDKKKTAKKSTKKVSKK
jgi:large subunit ribosomal protein L4